ncbi:hypothetical protein E0H22_17445 [Rhodopseudomonas boonkerdii]|uniref:hypothetical protein n=1 Tax=Rhodopseudomonas boonkerdii TaxID=475937 RepID=UPI001E5B4C6D|nr:hypothetical protein [Rhodopseudomonas boonkerdii]UGV27312.1 hypothetical protein E0H22_17445 [Rhodopseudomonas boonkerdii]
MRFRLDTALTGMAVCATVGLLLWPQARDAGAMLLAQDDPVALADARVSAALRHDPDMLAKQTEAALTDQDADLARSFVDLAEARGVKLPDDLAQRVNDAVAADASASNVAKRFATGFVTGNADDLATLSGTVAGDLFVFGDIRDAVREGKHLVSGEETDHLILGLAAAGLAVTAATYVSAGGAAPVRAGLTLVKDARKAGRIGEGLTAWTARSARGMVDGPVLKEAMANASVFRPGQTVAAIKTAFRTEKAGDIVRLAKDVGRVGEKAGTRGALDTLRIAQGPKDVARVSKLAAAKGGQTRAIIKLFGRGAVVLATGAFQLGMWLFWGLWMLIGLVISIKATTERLTWSLLQRSKARRITRELAERQDILLQNMAARSSGSPPALAPAFAQG